MTGARFRLVAAMTWIAIAPAAFAAPCSGFTDVEDSNTLCPDVDWLRNRDITLGCTSTTLFCPSSPVTRLAMAAFMNRLGTALTPTVLYNEASGATLDLDSPPPTVCATPVLAAAKYPRSVHAGAVLTALLGGAATPRLTIVQSTNGGTTWTPLSTAPSSVGGSSKWVNATVWKGNVPLAVNTSYRFGLRVDSAAGGSADLGTWNCQLRAIINSRTGTGVPH